MYTPVRNSKGANRDQIVHDRVFFSLPLQAMVINRLPKVIHPKSSCMFSIKSLLPLFHLKG